MTVTIYHNPRCSKSRTVLALIRGAGIEPELVEYLKGGLTRERLTRLVARMGVPIRDLLRKTEAPYRDLNLKDLKHTEDALIGFVVEHPILLNRPIVDAPKGARLCRPEDIVLDLIDSAAQQAPSLQS